MLTEPERMIPDAVRNRLHAKGFAETKDPPRGWGAPLAVAAGVAVLAAGGLAIGHPFTRDNLPATMPGHSATHDSPRTQWLRDCMNAITPRSEVLDPAPWEAGASTELAGARVVLAVNSAEVGVCAAGEREFRSFPRRPADASRPVVLPYSSAIAGTVPKQARRVVIAVGGRTAEADVWNSTFTAALPKPPADGAAISCRVLDGAGNVIYEGQIFG